LYCLWTQPVCFSRCIRLCHRLTQGCPRCNLLTSRVLEQLQHGLLDLPCLCSLLRMISQVHHQEVISSLPVEPNDRWEVNDPQGDWFCARRTQLHGLPHDHTDRPYVTLDGVVKGRRNFRCVIICRPNSLHCRGRRKERRDAEVADLLQQMKASERSTPVNTFKKP
jgi:hypothetical protein